MTASDRDAVSRLRERRRQARSDPAFTPEPSARRRGRPPWSMKMDRDGAILFILHDIFGLRPASALRVIGRDPSSGSKDYHLVKRRLKIYRQVTRWTPEEVRAWRYLVSHPAP